MRETIKLKKYWPISRETREVLVEALWFDPSASSNRACEVLGQLEKFSYPLYYERMAENAAVPVSKGKILIIEDEIFLSSLLKTRIQHDGFEVMIAEDGEEALEILKVKEQRPDLILLDIILPKKSGFELIGALQSDPELKKIPIVIISNLGQESDIARGKELGAVDYFVKARISIDDLLRKIAQHLGK